MIEDGTGFVEQVWFVYGVKIGPFYLGFLDYQNDGDPCRVKFDLKKAFFGKKGSKKHNKSMLGFYHSHPSGMLTPSSIDDATMDSWVKAKGRSLLCGIKCGHRQSCYLYYRVSKRKSETDYMATDSKLFFNRFLFVDTRRYLQLLKANS